jgi:hypothetical protein
MAASMGCLIFKRYSPGFITGPFVEYRNHEEFLSQADGLLSAPGSGEAQRTPSQSAPGFTSTEIRQWAISNHSIEIRCQKLLESVHIATAAA